MASSVLKTRGKPHGILSSSNNTDTDVKVVGSGFMIRMHSSSRLSKELGRFASLLCISDA